MANNVYVLIDASGSMGGIWNDAIGGVNDYVRNLKGVADKVMVATFDTSGYSENTSFRYNVIRNTNSSEFKEIGSNEVRPNGGTPLLDAAGRMLWHVLDDNPDRAVIVVVTDGEENSSTKFKVEEVKKLAQLATVNKDYEMVYLGANFDKVRDVAQKNFGLLDGSRTLSTSGNSRGIGNAWAATASASDSYFKGGKAAMFYSQDDNEKAKL